MLCTVICEKKCWKLCDPQEFPFVAGSVFRPFLFLPHHCTRNIWENSGSIGELFSSLDTNTECFWLWRKRQMVCMWCLQHSFGDASTAHCGGCVLWCSVRKQGMAMSTPKHPVVKIQAICSCEQVFPHQAKFYFEILCLAPSGIALRTGSVFGKGSLAKRDGGRLGTMNRGRSDHPTAASTWQAKEDRFAESHAGQRGSAPDGGAGWRKSWLGSREWWTYPSGYPKHLQLCNTQQNYLLHSLPFPSQSGNQLCCH